MKSISMRVTIPLLLNVHHGRAWALLFHRTPAQGDIPGARDYRLWPVIFDQSGDNLLLSTTARPVSRGRKMPHLLAMTLAEERLILIWRRRRGGNPGPRPWVQAMTDGPAEYGKRVA